MANNFLFFPSWIIAENVSYGQVSPVQSPNIGFSPQKSDYWLRGILW